MIPTATQRLRSYVGMFIMVILPMIITTGIALAIGIPELFAGLIGIAAWVGALVWLGDQDEKGTRIGRAFSKVGTFLGADYLD